MSRRIVPWTGRVVAGVFAVTVAIGLFIAPPDRLQGDAQRIMYVHVPSAWLAYLAFFVTFVGSGLYLWRRDLRFDRYAAAAAEVGTIFTALAIATGSLWGKVTWGIWWDWDPRLTTTAILLLVYLGYLLLRSSIVERGRRARIAAVIGLIGFLQVPVVHFSVIWWRSLHQAPSVIQPTGATIGPVLLGILMANVASFTLLFAWLWRRRVELEELRDRAELDLGAAE